MATWINLMDLIFPIGSFYISQQSTSPASIIGGSWTQVTDAVLRGSTSIGYIGSDTHTLTISEMPSHDHQAGSQNWVVYDAGGWASRNSAPHEQTYTSFNQGYIQTSFIGGGASTFDCATLLQLFHLVQNCLNPKVVA